MSCKNARSPITAKVFLRLSAIPITVEMFPSIPANPRFAKVSKSALGVAKLSISRIGRDEATKSVLFLGNCETNSFTTVGSLQLFR